MPASWSPPTSGRTVPPDLGWAVASTPGGRSAVSVVPKTLIAITGFQPGSRARGPGCVTETDRTSDVGFGQRPAVGFVMTDDEARTNPIDVEYVCGIELVHSARVPISREPSSGERDPTRRRLRYPNGLT